MTKDLLAQAQALLTLVLRRDGATLSDLGAALGRFRAQVAALPCGGPPDADPGRGDRGELARQVAQAWPELGLYDLGSGRPLLAGSCQSVPDELGDAHDDLTGFALELHSALSLAPLDRAAALARLRWSLDAHWDDLITGLLRHLEHLKAAGP
ncbi:hypothetical protein [Deinococcus hohokamensis]|uniref:Uncharacterized protein n=1 Tax=Deinococcus hohokamensis TaxID=309883 RepID=A0ABV9I490_9DEIO